MLALARDPDVESRLVQTPGAGSAASWRLRQGPFARLPPRKRPGWTLLVQGVDLHLPAARALMDRFRFLPDARLDDLMVSFATDGGGVGPHVDSYDVFLLQVHGRRRWRIAPPGQSALLPGAPLRILAEFNARQQWELDEGDMLYLPPGWAHEGTAVGECMTCSIGFRSPSVSELRQAFFAFLSDHPPLSLSAGRAAHLQRRYRDRTRSAVERPAEIPTDMVATLRGWLEDWRPATTDIERFIGCYLTDPKPTVWFDAAPDNRLPAVAGAGLVLDRRTRMLYCNGAVFINGDAVSLPARTGVATRGLLRLLADQRGLDAVQASRALRLPWLGARLREWLLAGWIVARETPNASL